MFRRAQSPVKLVPIVFGLAAILTAPRSWSQSAQEPAAVSVEVRPTAAVAGTFQELTLAHTVGPMGIEAGGGIRFELPVAYGETEPYFWSKPQIRYPDGPGFVTASTSGMASVAARTYGVAGGIFEAFLTDGRLEPGDLLIVVYRGVVQSLARDVHLRYQVRPSATSNWSDGPSPPIFIVLPQEAYTLITTTPADVEIGEPFETAVVAIDRFGNRATGYRGTISLQSTDSATVLTHSTYTFSEKNRGVRRFREVQFGSPGFQRIVAVDMGRDLQLSWHYAWVSDEAPDLRRFFGDTHFHTGTGTGNRGFLAFEEPGDINTMATKRFQRLNSGGDHRGNFTDARSAYTYARDVVRLDFASSAEHDAVLFDSLAWRQSQAISSEFYEPGRFTTFFAYEWTPSSIHHVVVYKEPGQTVFDRDRFDDLPSLWTQLDQQQSPALTIPHVTWPLDGHLMWKDVNNTYRRLGELYSLWNNRFLIQPGDMPQRFELGIDDHWSYQHAWTRGHRIGVVGSSDNHLGQPGANNYTIHTQHAGGFAAAIAGRNDRDALWEAFQQRRTYATTGTRIYLDIQSDGYPMGAEYITTRPPTLDVRVAGTNTLALVEIVRYADGGYATIRAESPGAEYLAFSHVDDEFGELCRAQHCLYYVRVTQEPEYPGRPWSYSTAEMAWSSPIWVRYSEPENAGDHQNGNR